MTRQSKVVHTTDGRQGSLQFLITAADTGGAFEWMESELPYAQGPIYHSHQCADEVMRVLEGEVKIKLDGRMLDLTAGEACFIPRGVAHSFTNVHPERPARTAGIYAPAGMQAFMELWESLTHQDGMPDEITLAELAARYGQVVLGPPLAEELKLPRLERPIDGAQGEATILARRKQ